MKKKYIGKVLIIIIILILSLYIGNITLSNKIYKQRIYNQENYVINKSKFINFSIDDTINIFKDITENNYSSIFDNETLRIFKYLHNKYGTTFTLYCFYEKDDFNLSKAKTNYKSEFEANSKWLKFGFHSLNSNSNYQENPDNFWDDFDRTYKALENIVGS